MLFASQENRFFQLNKDCQILAVMAVLQTWKPNSMVSEWKGSTQTEQHHLQNNVTKGTETLQQKD